jgi:hypothetical protein
MMENTMQQSFMTHLSGSWANNTLNFFSTDSLEAYNANLAKQSEDWVYRTKQITYQTNELGFREKPFADIDWANSIVVIGCSHVFGYGLAYEDTFCAVLSHLLATPVVNLGIPSAGPDLAHYNSLILHNHYPRPKAIVQAWSSLDRYVDMTVEGEVIPYLPRWNSYIYDHNWVSRNKLYVESDRALWRDKLPYVELSFFPFTASTLEIHGIDFEDKARDLSHPGIKTVLNSASYTATQLQAHK